MTGGSKRREVDGAEAVAELYDAFAPSLYRYAWSLLGDEGDRAADAVHDGLVAGVALAGFPADPADRGPRLYALVRAACRQLGLARSCPYTRLAVVPAEEPTALMLSRVPAGHRELLELRLRHALPVSAVSRVLGLDTRVCGELVRSAVRRAADNLPGAEEAPRAPSGAEEAPGTEPPAGPSLRVRTRQVSAALELLTPPGPPPGLRERVVRTCTAPESAAERERIVRGMQPLTPEGYPQHRVEAPGRQVRAEGPAPAERRPEPPPRILPRDRVTTRDVPDRGEVRAPLPGPGAGSGRDRDRDGRRRRLLPAASGLATAAIAVALWSWAAATEPPPAVVGAGPSGTGPSVTAAPEAPTSSSGPELEAEAAPFAPQSDPGREGAVAEEGTREDAPVPEEPAPSGEIPDQEAGAPAEEEPPAPADPRPGNDGDSGSGSAPGGGGAPRDGGVPGDGSAPGDDSAPGDGTGEGSDDGGERKGLLSGLVGLLLGGG